MRILFFAVIFVCSLASIWQNKDKINADIFSLLGVNLGHYEEQIIKNLNSQNNFSILFKNIDDKDKILVLAEDSGLFERLENKSEDFHINSLSNFTLALMDKDKISLLRDDKEAFFEDSIKNLFSSFNRILSDDFFSLVSNLNANLVGDFDLQSGLLKTQNFYLINYELKQNYDYNKLLDFAMELKKIDDLHINSASLYASYAKQTAMRESSIFGGASIILSIIFILLAFRNLKSLYLMLIVIFSLICSLGITLLLLKSLNVLTLVISTSLIGLILDYPLHFLSANMGIKILPNSVKKVRNTIISAFCINVLGYLVFIISPMKFLHEIAIFSIFALVAAVFSAYFLFPHLIKNEIFSSSSIIDKCVDFYINLCRFSKKHIKILMIFVVLLIIIAAIKVQNLHFYDNIKSYSSAPKALIDDSIIFSKEINNHIKTTFIIIDEDKSKILAEILKERNLIQNAFFISDFINDIGTQNEIKEAFKDTINQKNIVEKYKNIGIEKGALKSEIAKIANQHTASGSEICKAIMPNKCHYFFMDNKEIIYVDGVKKDSSFDEILASFNASYSDYISTLNNNFDNIKLNALMLKLIALVVALAILSAFLGIKSGIKIISYIILVSFLSSLIFISLNLNLDIFMIFGLILGSAVGIEYMLFAHSKGLDLRQRILGILFASLTTIISFSMLTLSSTNAVFNFGLSVSIFVILMSFIASITALEDK